MCMSKYLIGSSDSLLHDDTTIVGTDCLLGNLSPIGDGDCGGRRRSGVTDRRIGDGEEPVEDGALVLAVRLLSHSKFPEKR